MKNHPTQVVIYAALLELTMAIADKINETQQGCFAAVKFSGDQIRELRMAAWLHDVGKITTPDYIIDKRTKIADGE